jgi:tryptophan synthase beta chain
VRDLQRVIGEEARRQSMMLFGRLPDVCVACVGGGSNSLGLFHPFIDDEDVQLVGVEAAGHGLDSGKHGAPLARGTVGVLHGSMSYVLQDDDGQIVEAHSVSAGLDYPGVGPEHSHLKDIGRVRYAAITDAEALDAFGRLAKLEGILPALESAHAIAFLDRLAKEARRGELVAAEGDGPPVVVVSLSGRGDKDVQQVIELRGEA